MSSPIPSLIYLSRSHLRILRLLVSLLQKQAMRILKRILCTILTQMLTRPFRKTISRVGPFRHRAFVLDYCFLLVDGSSSSSSRRRTGNGPIVWPVFFVKYKPLITGSRVLYCRMID